MKFSVFPFCLTDKKDVSGDFIFPDVVLFSQIGLKSGEEIFSMR